MDVSKLTLEQIREYQRALKAEEVSRNKEQQMQDRAWTLIMDARNHGYSKGAVGKTLQSILNQAYGQRLPAEEEEVVEEPEPKPPHVPNEEAGRGN